MKQPLIELIVQAVYKAIYTNPMTEETELSAKQLIRTALASIQEMPQVDLGEVEKLVQFRVDIRDSHVPFVNVMEEEQYASEIRESIGYTLTDLEQFKKQKG